MIDFQDSEAILGPLPYPWRVQCVVSNENGVHRFCYVNMASGFRCFEDPRLPPIDGWESLGLVPQGESSRLVTFFKNAATGEVSNSDPRLRLEALEKLGIRFQTFVLI